MSNRIYTTALTVPAKTPIATPFVQAVILDDEHLDKVEVLIPAGHVGLTGVAIISGGVFVAPYIQGTWITGDNEKVTYTHDQLITAAGFSAAGYNLDRFAHTFRFRWYVSTRQTVSPVVIETPQAGSVPAQTVPGTIAQLAGVITVADLAAIAAQVAAPPVHLSEVVAA